MFILGEWRGDRAVFLDTRYERDRVEYRRSGRVIDVVTTVYEGGESSRRIVVEPDRGPESRVELHVPPEIRWP